MGIFSRLQGGKTSYEGKHISGVFPFVFFKQNGYFVPITNTHETTKPFRGPDHTHHFTELCP